VARIADVDARGVRVHHVEPGVGRRDPPAQLPSLLPIQPPRLQPFKGGQLALCHGILSSRVLS
jgi:hypothetical protein